MLADAHRLAAFAASVRRYLRTDFSEHAVRQRLELTLATRGERLLALVERGVFARSRSPYLQLFRHAGVELGDVRRLVRDRGVEGALLTLRDTGVYLTAEELKGRAPIVRGSLVRHYAPEDFDNPLRAEGALVARSGGSSGMPVRVGLGVDDLVEDVGYLRLWIAGRGAQGKPVVIWRSVPPARSGLRSSLRHLRTGLVLEEWWSPREVGLRHGARDAVALQVALLVVRAHGERIVRPRHAPLDDPAPVVDAVAERVRAGRQPVVLATAGAAVRLCRAATELGIAFTGAHVVTGGEPLTASKAEAITRTGATVACDYQAHEVGRIGFACSTPDVVDDVHVAEGRVAVIEGTHADDESRLLLTCLSPTSQRLMLNADIGDTGVLVRRECECPAGELGLDLHVHTIRAAAKITTDGTNILHAELLDLVERVLPERFGGGPTDYQLVETEDGGVPRLDVVVSPRVGHVDDQAVVDTLLAVVGAGPAWRDMTREIWRAGATVHVRRRDPYATHVGKVHAFHVERR